MNKIITLTLLLAVSLSTLAQDKDIDRPVKKGDYKILKLDALNLIGIGIQKLRLDYEVSPMKANQNNLPTVNFNVTIPFNGLSDIDINYGVEAGVELRFYQRKRHASSLVAEGFFIGAGLDGGYVDFSRTQSYYNSSVNGTIYRETETDYGRVRTGIYLVTGGQTQLGDKLYFNLSMGLGWSNVNVTAQEDINLEGFTSYSNNLPLTKLLYNEGKGQRIYTPVSIGIGYNFGNR
jgi:hypothetical protein